jgi:hypothetical protein
VEKRSEPLMVECSRLKVEGKCNYNKNITREL